MSTASDGARKLSTSPFVGRVEELTRTQRELRAGAVVGLVGPPGVGKTRLSAEVARPYRRQGTVVELPLRGARDREDVLSSLARGLGLDLPNRPQNEQTDALASWLIDLEPELVIADAAEGLKAPAVQTLDSIRRATKSPWLFTSQRALRIGEALVDVTPLSRTDARELLVQRIRRARGGAAPTDLERPRLDELASRLDRLPLPIELAGARLSVLSVDELLGRLAESFDALGNNRTLAATIDWALSLLEPAEQEGLAQLCVFRGGFDVEAAEAVLDIESDVIDFLSELVERSLVFVERQRDGRARFALYESIEHRVVARPSRGVAAAQQRHARFIAEALPGWAHTDPRRLVEERPNISVASAYVEDPALRIDLILHQEPWRFGGRSYTEDRARIELAISMAREIDDCVRLTRALLESARFHRLRSEWSIAAERLQEAEALVRSDGEQGPRLGVLLVEQARLCCDRGAHDETHRLLEEGLRLTGDDSRVRGDAELTRGILAYRRDDLEESIRCFTEAREQFRDSGDRSGEGVAQVNLALAIDATGRTAECAERLREAVVILSEVGNLRSEGMALGNLANKERHLGRREQAHALFERALRIHRFVGNRGSEALNRCYLARLLIAEGELDRATDELREARRVGEGAVHQEELPQIVEVELELGAARGDSEAVERARHELQRLRTDPTCLVVDGDGRWFRGPDDDQVIELGRRRSARLLLRELAHRRLAVPGEALPLEQVVATGWPGERIIERAARQRVYVLVNTLRGLGLTALQTSEAGYLLDPKIPLRLASGVEH